MISPVTDGSTLLKESSYDVEDPESCSGRLECHLGGLSQCPRVWFLNQRRSLHAVPVSISFTYTDDIQNTLGSLQKMIGQLEDPYSCQPNAVSESSIHDRQERIKARLWSTKGSNNVQIKF